MRTRASILVGLLWCLALLSLVVISVLHTARLDLIVQKNYGDRIQAHYLALAGIEKAKALLYQDVRERNKARKNHTGNLYDDPEDFRKVKFGPGQFSVFRPGRAEEGGGVIYGISDEESRLNVNYAGAEELAKLPGMAPEIVAAILDWRDEDNNVSPGGAEAEYYTTLRPPYLPRNGLMQTTRELLMVRGISTETLLGRGEELPELDEQEGENGLSSAQPETDRGWNEMFAVDGWVANLNAAGEDRVNVQNADEKTLSGIPGISQEIARAIVAYRGQNKLESLADLLDVTAAQNQPGRTGAQARSGGPKVISEDLFMEIADDVCVDTTRELAGPVNLNTASAAVLACLPGMTPELAQAVANYRRSIGFLPNTASVLKAPGMTREIFKQLAGRVTARSETFRIISEGKVMSSGARQRIQAIIHMGKDDIKTLSYREDL